MGYSANLWEPVDHEENANDTPKEIPAENLKRNVYRDSIVALMDRQREKGLKKYGVTLEQNATLTTEQRIEHAEEELIDALQYLEHLKVSLADKMTANDYQRAAMRTASGMNYDQVGGNGLLLNGVMGLNGEAGECIDIVKKHIFQGHELDREHLIEELGDAAWYLAVSCEAVGVTLGEVMQRNVDKLKKRYPDGFDKSRSIKREETND
jgi:NTP pyrophosphatase (non-canonical NTP hydrolase)